MEVRAGPVCLECGQGDPVEGVLQALPRRIGRGNPPARPHSSEVVVQVRGDGFHSGCGSLVDSQVDPKGYPRRLGEKCDAEVTCAEEYSKPVTQLLWFKI